MAAAWRILGDGTLLNEDAVSLMEFDAEGVTVHFRDGSGARHYRREEAADLFGTLEHYRKERERYRSYRGE